MYKIWSTYKKIFVIQCKLSMCTRQTNDSCLIGDRYCVQTPAANTTPWSDFNANCFRFLSFIHLKINTGQWQFNISMPNCIVSSSVVNTTVVRHDLYKCIKKLWCALEIVVWKSSPFFYIRFKSIFIVISSANVSKTYFPTVKSIWTLNFSNSI